MNFKVIFPVVLFLFMCENLFPSEFFLQTSYTNSEVYYNSTSSVTFLDFHLYRSERGEPYFEGSGNHRVYSGNYFFLIGVTTGKNKSYFETGMGMRKDYLTIYTGTLFSEENILIHERILFTPLKGLKIAYLFFHTSEKVTGKLLRIRFNEKFTLSSNASMKNYVVFSLSRGFIPAPLIYFHIGGYPFMKAFKQDYDILTSYFYATSEFYFNLPPSGTFLKIFVEGVDKFPVLLIDGGMSLLVKLTGLSIEAGYGIGSNCGRIFFNLKTGVGF